MPRIRTYNQEQGLGTRAVSPVRSRAPAAPAEGLQSLGAGLSALGQGLERREATEIKKEVTRANEELANLNKKYSFLIKDGINKGSVDSENLFQQYQKEVETLQGNFEHTESLEYLDRQSGFLGANLARSSALAEAQVNSKNEVKSIDNSLNANANALQNNPAGFQSTLEQTFDFIDTKFEQGVLTKDAADKLRQEASQRLASSAVLGWTEINPQTAETLLNQGVYDEYLDPQQKKTLQTNIRVMKNATEAEEARRKKALKEAKAKEQEAWKTENLEKLVTSELTTKEVFNSPLGADEKLKWVKAIKKEAEEDLQTDPVVYNNVVKRILLPTGDPNKVTDVGQIVDKVGSGLTASDLNQIKTIINNTPEGRYLNESKGKLMDVATAELVKRDAMGNSDPDGEYNLSQFMREVHIIEEQYRKDGKDPFPLYDPTSKEYLGNKILKYKKTPMELMRSRFKQTPRKQFEPTTKNPRQRKEGESAQEYLKRIGK